MSEKTEPASDTGNGVLAAAKPAGPATAAPLTPSPAARKGNRRTGIEPTLEESLEILQQALVNLQRLGVTTRAFNRPEHSMTVLALSGAGYCQACCRLRPLQAMRGEKCQYCS